MDQSEQRTLYVGLIIGLVIYALGFAVPFFVEGEAGQYVSLVVTFTSMAFVLGWFFAVRRRGFRLGKKTRQGRRLKTRAQKRGPMRPPF